jgi:hypothetical protein
MAAFFIVFLRGLFGAFSVFLRDEVAPPDFAPGLDYKSLCFAWASFVYILEFSRSYPKGCANAISNLSGA